MVTQQDLISLIKSPSSLKTEDVEELQKLYRDYPYCNTLALLITKGFHQNKLIGYHQVLKDTAISIPNREVLYHLIYQKIVQEKITAQEAIDKNVLEQNSITSEKVKESEKAIEDSAGEIDTSKLSAKKENEVDIEDSQEIADTDTSLQDDNKKTSQEDIGEIIAEKSEEKINKLEQLILASALSSSYNLNEKKLDQQKDIPSDKISEEVEKKENIIPKINSDKSFFGWLSPNYEEKQENKKSIDELVDAFIKDQENEKIERKEFFSPTSVAKISLLENEEFVTETLAEIYFKQKNYIKAIEAYEKLILKNPEKKPYFAIRIKKIQDLLNK